MLRYPDVFRFTASRCRRMRARATIGGCPSCLVLGGGDNIEALFVNVCMRNSRAFETILEPSLTLSRELHRYGPSHRVWRLRMHSSALRITLVASQRIHHSKYVDTSHSIWAGAFELRNKICLQTPIKCFLQTYIFSCLGSSGPWGMTRVHVFRMNCVLNQTRCDATKVRTGCRSACTVARLDAAPPSRCERVECTKA